MKRYSILKKIAIYYLMATVFMIASYVLLRMVYGAVNVSIFEWALIIFSAFTIGYVPVLIRLLRRSGG